MRALLAALAACPTLAPAQEAGAPWDWQLQPPLDLTAPVATLGLEPDAVTPDDLAALRDRGVATICYVSVGTTEDWRPDAAAFPPEVVGRAYDGWPGERFLDIRRLDALLPIMTARLDRCAAMGFDAVEPDNMDVHVNDSGFPVAEDDVVAYVAALAEVAHGLGLRVAQKNAPDLTPRLAPLLDFAMTEDCLADGWCEAMAPYAGSGRAVLAAEYDVAQAERPALCARAAALGLSLAFKTLELTAEGTRCP